MRTGIGSREAWFPTVSASEVSDPAAYFWNRAPCHAPPPHWRWPGLSAAPPAPFEGIRTLFPGITLPSPLQTWAETVTLPPGPALAVIEDVTGSGKTEVALAHRLLAAGRADGVFFALPTMATASAMFGRMASAYRRLFRPGASPSLALAHGRAALDLRFAAMMTAGTPADAGGARRGPTRRTSRPRRIARPGSPMTGGARCWPRSASEPSTRRCWLVLPVRHAALRQQGLKGKVLVVDEAHAFDAYMARELVELLRFHAALGGSVILLSATLSLAVRQRLIDAFRSGLGAASATVSEMAYPLATIAGASGIVETQCRVRDGLARRVAVTRVADARAALARIMAAAHGGAAVAWARNTVDDAIAAAAAVRAAGLEPLLFHARFAMADRLAIEQEVLRFGPAGTPADRGRVLTATQVIEQSLDLDFDLLCTDLAPADLLIQRAGRLWRHARAGSDRLAPGPELLVLSPEPVDDPPSNWISASQPGAAAVYRDPALLWRSARAVFDAGCIATPGDMRRLIEHAAEGPAPANLLAQADRAAAKAMAHRALAGENVLDFEEGYTRQSGGWEPDTDTPTRLENEPHVTLRLALSRDGAVVPYAPHKDPAHAWSLSEVSVAARHAQACPPPPGLKQAAALARASLSGCSMSRHRCLPMAAACRNPTTPSVACCGPGATWACAWPATRRTAWNCSRGSACRQWKTDLRRRELSDDAVERGGLDRARLVAILAARPRTRLPR